MPLSIKIISFFLFFIPFIYYPWVESPSEFPKIIITYGFILLWTSITWFIALKNKRFSQAKLSLYISLMFFIVLTIGSSIYNHHLWPSIIGNHQRFDGLLTLVSFSFLSLSISYTFPKKHYWLLASSLGSSAIAISCWVNFIFILRLNGYFNTVYWKNAVGFTFDNPNLLAGFLLVTIPFANYFIQSLKIKNKIIHSILLGSIFLAIFATQSVIGVIGIIFWILMEVFAKYIKSRKKLVIFIGCFFLVTLCSAWMTGFINNTLDLTADNRSRILQKLIFSAKKKPLFGYGWSNVEYAFSSSSPPNSLHRENDILLDKAHSSALEVLVSTGITGLLLFVSIQLMLINITYQNFVKKEIESNYLEKSIFFALVLFIWHSQLNVVSISQEIIFWIILGMSGKIQTTHYLSKA
jgi:O-antigen ligase